MEEQYTQEAKQAQVAMRNADHMLKVTYPLVKDPKLLLGVIENLRVVLYKSLAAHLHYLRLYRRVPPFQETQESMLNMFSMKVVGDTFTGKDAELFATLDALMQAHKDSSVEFTKDGKLVMASNTYALETIDAVRMKQLVDDVKDLHLRLGEATL